MNTKEQYARWLLRSACIGGFIVGLLVPVWEERWTAWGAVASVSVIVLVSYGYWKLMPLEALAAKKIASLLCRLES
jgi:hypothetical protein